MGGEMRCNALFWERDAILDELVEERHLSGLSSLHHRGLQCKRAYVGEWALESSLRGARSWIPGIRRQLLGLEGEVSPLTELSFSDSDISSDRER